MTYGRNMLLLFIVVLFSSLSSGLVTPIWPIYVRSLGSSMEELGYIFAISNGVGAILQILGGFFSDRYGRKKLYVIGTFLGIFPPLFYIFATWWTDLIPWVILAGISVGLSMSIRWSIIADESSIERRALAYSWVNIALFMGMTIGPVAGGLMADTWGIKLPLISSFVLTILCFILSLQLHETRRSSHRQIRIRTEVENSTVFWSVFLYSLSNLLASVGLGIYGPITPVFVKNRFATDYAGVGLVYSVGFGLSSGIVQLPGGRLATKYSKKAIIVLSVAGSAPFYGLFAISRSLVESMIFMFLSNAIMNVSWPAYQDLLMELTPRKRWGLVNGVSVTTYWVGMMIGSAISGVLWERLGMFFPYYVSALIVFASAMPILFLKKRSGEAEP